MFLQTCFKPTIPGYKSLGEVADLLGNDVLKYLTLRRRVKDRHATVRRTIRDPNEPRFWIVPDADVELLTAEANMIRELRQQGYTVSVQVAEKKLGLTKGVLLKKDIGQKRILSVWKITEKMFRKLWDMGRERVEALPSVKVDLLAEAGTRKGDKPVLGPTDEWLDAWKVRAVVGALKPYAYTSRVNVFKKKYGKDPDWAKREDGQWLFKREYIEADAEVNLKYIGVAEMARELLCSARTIINWIDAGRIPCEGRSTEERGNERRVLREKFVALLPILKPRLETAANIAVQEMHGHPLPKEIVERFEAKQKLAQETKTLERRLAEAERKRQQRLADQEAEKKQALEARELKQKQRDDARAQKHEQALAEKERKRQAALDERANKTKRQENERKEKLAEESARMKHEFDECGYTLDQIKPQQDKLREELRCGRVGTLYLGKKPRREKTIILKLNDLQVISEEATYGRYRLGLKLGKGVKT